MKLTRALRIGITDDHRTPSKVDEYRAWLRGLDADLDLQLLSTRAEHQVRVEDLDGVLLTGGGDVHPKFYGRDDLLDRTEGVVLERDIFEMRLIEQVLERNLPMLAVCRGVQVLNVALGGSLHHDLASLGFNDHRGPGEHPLHVDPHAMLFFAAGARETPVNTSHHQALDRLGNGLQATGFAPDGVIEAVEWSSKEGMPFLMGVQWHPERLPDHLLSRNLAGLFLKDVRRFRAERGNEGR
ncbi:MAG: gamma-glutamyl-gamma-aminobutyrate hydrolase family protein [Bacteroidetes bacterium]|nr:gamma-glutamyl-gamma-aminobutyrate hydrolase family protein [Bacteroidota bacterium]